MKDATRWGGVVREWPSASTKSAIGADRERSRRVAGRKAIGVEGACVIRRSTAVEVGWRGKHAVTTNRPPQSGQRAPAGGVAAAGGSGVST